MNNKADEQLLQILQALSLSDSILQGVQHLTQHPDNLTLAEDIQLAVASVKSVLSPNTDETTSDQWDIALSGQSVDIQTLAGAEQWCSEILKNAITQIDKILNGTTYIASETADALYQWMDNLNTNDRLRGALLFQISRKCALSAPAQSYENMYKAFRVHPALIAVSGREPYDSGRTVEQHQFECCPICGGNGAPYYAACSYLMNDYHPLFEPAKLWLKCNTCGDLYSWHYPKSFLENTSSAKRIYPQTMQPAPSGSANSIVLHTWSNIFNQIGTYTNGNRVLEVGVGDGSLIAVALEMGYQIDGVELMESTAQKVSNLLGEEVTMWCCDFLRFESPERYDIITMGDVIEHVGDPSAALKKAHALLNEDGVLWLSTPNYESAFSRILKFDDAMWLEPHHVSYFSYRGLRRLAEQCGFQVKRYTVSNRYNGSMELFLTKK